MQIHSHMQADGPAARVDTRRAANSLSSALARFFAFGALAVFGALAGGLTACSTRSEAAPTLYLSAIPDANKSELADGYARIAAYLARELGVDVRFRPAVDYSASVEAFKNGDVQLVWYGGVTGVQARRAVPGARAIAQGKIDPEFQSYFVAHVGAGIAPSDTFPMDLAGKTFLFGPASSTSGRVMPEWFIREATGRAPEEFFGHPNRNSKGHDLTATDVEAGTVDAGVLASARYDAMVAAGQLDPTRCIKIWTTPNYPDYNFTAHPDLERMFGAGFTDRLQAVLVGLDDPALLRVLLRDEGLIPADNDAYAATVKAMEAIGM